jgi:hypothetical protein
MDLVGMSAAEGIKGKRSELRSLGKAEHTVAVEALQF